MEITKSLRSDIVKIQNELITAIQNHQVLVLKQQVGPTDSIKLQLEEVQRHIICLGESQKLLVSRLQNEIESQKLRVNNRKQNPAQQVHKASSNDSVRFNTKGKHQEQQLGRSLLLNNVHREQQLRVKSESEVVSERLGLTRTVDSSSEENRTPCPSPPLTNGNSDAEERGTKRAAAPEPHWSPSKRAKHTLQSAPRRSSPVPAKGLLNTLSCSSDESLDSLSAECLRPKNSLSQVDFALALGLVTKEGFNKILVKKSERRRRRTNSQPHHLYNESWDLTVQGSKRGRSRVHAEDTTPPLSPTPPSPDLCYVCNKPVAGEVSECRVCQVSCHPLCATDDICDACAIRENQITEKRKKLDELRSTNTQLHKTVSKMRERAKVLSASLVRQTESVNHLLEQEDHLTKTINKIKDFVAHFQAGTSTGSQIDQEDNRSTGSS